MINPASISSTYRLQLTPTFTFDDAINVLDYLTDLGVGAVYCSPLLKSSEGSDHGYDVVDPGVVDAARGGEAEWARFAQEAKSRGLAIVVDIVPNHVGVADAAQNPYWWDVLRVGQSSPYASWFDIEWSRGKVLLPVLGDDADDSDLTLVGDELRYYEHRFPIAPGTEAGDGEDAAQVHARQHYQLVNFRRADTEQNYRRFFAVTTLAGVRVEDDAVAHATHERVLRWLREDGVAGIRVDHPDGLADPPGYLRWLRAQAGDAWLLIEKILEPSERLPADWPVDGTTGYDALAEVGPLFIDPAAEQTFDELYRAFTGDHKDFHTHVQIGKRSGASTILRAELNRLARLVPQITGAVDALRELAVAFPVYRSYLPEGAGYLAAAVAAVRSAQPELNPVIDELLPRLSDPEDELCRRFQQVTGAVMAKGVEDTAYYRYTRFIALNEVGGDPSRFGWNVADFHHNQQLRQAQASSSMTTLSTHDTKRGEDVRARLAVLAEVPQEWFQLVTQLSKAVPMPNAAFGYLLWQTFAGVGFIERDRMHAYARKAMREAAEGTTWIDPVDEFETMVHAGIDTIYDTPELRAVVQQFVDEITPFGWSNSISQKLAQLTMPGIPDVYQGTEGWEDSLVDPDNRRRIDYHRQRGLLAVPTPAVDASGAAKAWIVSRALRLRRERPDLFTSYTPIETGSAHLVAFDRGGAITVLTRLPVGLVRSGGWGELSITLPVTGAGVTDVLTGREFGAQIHVAELLQTYPGALLVAN